MKKKIVAIATGLSLLATGTCAFAYGNNVEVCRVAASQWGVVETPINEVWYNTWHYKTKVNGDDYPWCATFVSWVMREAGVTDNVICETAAVKDFVYEGISKNTFFDSANRGGWYQPSEGDVVNFQNYDKYGNIRWDAHTGIVIEADGYWFKTEEGNTKMNEFDDNGGCVASHSYNSANKDDDNWKVRGFVHPMYIGLTTGEWEMDGVMTNSMGPYVYHNNEQNVDLLMIPARTVADGLNGYYGADFGAWPTADGTGLWVSDGGYSKQVTYGYMVTNSQGYKAPIVVKNGVSFVPAKWYADLFGLNISYEQSQGRAYIWMNRSYDLD